MGKKSNLPRELAEKAKAEQAIKPFFVIAKDADGKEVRVYPKSMTRGQLKILGERDLDPYFWEETRTVTKVQLEQEDGEEQSEQEKQAAMMAAYIEAAEKIDGLKRRSVHFFDAVIELAYPGIDFDDTPNADLVKLAQFTYRITRGQENEIKNS